MAGQSPSHLAPPIDEDATPQQCISVWLDLLRSGSKLLMAGLRREVGPDGDVHAALRRWYAEQMEEHDKAVVHMLERMNQSEGGDGG